MELLNELGNDLAMAFLAEKRHREKIDSHSAQVLIIRVKHALSRWRKVMRNSEVLSSGFSRLFSRRKPAKAGNRNAHYFRLGA